MIKVIQIGLDPDVIDYTSPDFAMFPGLTKEILRRANDDNIAGLRAAGFEVDGCLIDFGATAADKVGQMIAAKKYDAVLIGAGVRLVASNSVLFEDIVNLVHAELPDAQFVFNWGPKATPEDIQRRFPSATTNL
jgi:hypothetical protein